MKVKILIIRFSSIGDIVLTTPVIRCLKLQLEGEVEIHYLTKKGYVEILSGNPYLSKVHYIEKEVSEVIESLKSENFDYIVDLHKNLRSSQVKRKLKSFSFTFDKLNIQKWLLVNFKVNRLPDVHIVDRYLETVKALGVINDGKGLDYFIPEEITSSILPENFSSKYIALVLGATYFTKRLPQHKLVEIAKEINFPLVLIGGKEDQKSGEDIEKHNPERIFNAAGKGSINESALLLKNAHSVISHDTGMMHIAAAFNTRIISVWGNTVPEFGMYPYLPKKLNVSQVIIENRELSCRPCSKIGYSKCPKGHFKCMEDLPVNQIVNSAK